MAKTNSTTTLENMSLATPAASPVAGPAQFGAQRDTVRREESTRKTFKALKKAQNLPADLPSSTAEISIAVLASLDCIIVDEYKKDFSLFAAQEQKTLPNPNVEDIEVMTRENSTIAPIGQFPSVDSAFYELDEGFSIPQEKEKLNADLATQNYSMVVSDIMSENFSSDASTLKQLSATTLNVSSAPSQGIPSTTKKITNTTKVSAEPTGITTTKVSAEPTGITTTKVSAEPTGITNANKTLAAPTATSTRNTMAATNYNAKIKY